MTLSLPDLLRLPILDRLTRYSKPLNPCRHTAVARCLQYYLPDLLFSAAIIQRASNVRRKFSPAILTTQHRDIEE